MIQMTRLERRRPGNVGNLGFLPVEICNEIHTCLLAEFKPVGLKQLDGQTMASALEDQLAEFTRARHSIETAILSTSRDIYCEAYNLMFKKNRFIRVTSQGVPKHLMSTAPLPVVTAVTDHVKDFRGYVLRVTMTFPGQLAPSWKPVAYREFFEAMILAKDLDKLCLGLMQGDLFIPHFKDGVVLTLYLGPAVTVSPKTLHFEDLRSLERGLCSETNQIKVIQPFSDWLKDFKNVRLYGLVLADVAESFSKRTTWGDLDTLPKIVDDITDAVQPSLVKPREKVWSGPNPWIKGICLLNMLRNGDLWPRIVAGGSQDLIADFAQLYFALCLYSAAFYMQAVGGKEAFTSLVGNLLERASRAMATGRWKEEITWVPTDRGRADLHCLRARYLRVRGNNGDFYTAWREIVQATNLFPNDPDYLTEKDLMSAWW
jgi:hypothetical protein